MRWKPQLNWTFKQDEQNTHTSVTPAKKREAVMAKKILVKIILKCC